jgi:Protein of unknown function (DUF2927)
MRRSATVACAALLTGIGLSAMAEDFDGVHADTLLSDQDFFRLATCGAEPGGGCRSPTIRWTEDEVTVALLPGDSEAEQMTADRIAGALEQAIIQINQLRTGLTLRRVTGARADIKVRTTDIAEGTRLADQPGVSAPGIMGVGYVTLWWNDADRIVDASILFSTGISDEDLTSVVLEELYQSLGPRYDIEGAAYEGVSILSQTSNATQSIQGQDAALLHWLYPPQP